MEQKNIYEYKIDLNIFYKRKLLIFNIIYLKLKKKKIWKKKLYFFKPIK